MDAPCTVSFHRIVSKYRDGFNCLYYQLAPLLTLVNINKLASNMKTSTSSSKMRIPVDFSGVPAMKVRKRRTPYVRDSGFVPPPLPPYVIDPERLVYLFCKKLQNSDVSEAGRTVLPKRAAEDHLPTLLEKQSLLLPLIDVDGGGERVFKFRYWPNNQSRMYVFEGTGTFTERYRLQAGDYMLIYKDPVNWGYFIRAVKASEVEGNEKGNAAPNDAAAEGGDAAKNADMAGTSSKNEDDYFSDILNSFSSWDEFKDYYCQPTPPSGSSDDVSDEDFPHV